MLENRYKTILSNKIKKMLPGCIVLHINPNEIQGIPDLLILYKSNWATLEGKRNKNAPHRPNQDYWVKLMDDMSFSRFIYPENEKEVLDELQIALRS